jgi:hypothetical protein
MRPGTNGPLAVCVRVPVPPCALVMVRTALDYKLSPDTRRGTQVRRPASNQFAGCIYRSEWERISRLLWVVTNHRGDWIRFCFNCW